LRLPCAAHLTLSSSLPPFPSLPSISLWQFDLDRSGAEGAACVAVGNECRRRRLDSGVRPDIQALTLLNPLAQKIDVKKNIQPFVVGSCKSLSADHIDELILF
jgi:hypothetical protein